MSGVHRLRPRIARVTRLALPLGLLLGLTLAACGSPARAPRTAEPATTDPVPTDPLPTDAAVAITTSACGHSSKTIGSGVLIDDDLVLTAAHVASGAGDITVTTAAGTGPAQLVSVDPTRDLALLQVPTELVGSRAELAAASARPGDAVTIIGTTSGRVTTELGSALTLRVDDVGAATRSERRGWDLPVRLRAGDSGAPVFDPSGHVVAMIFSATAERSGRSFAVDVSEIRAFIEGATQQTWRCEPEQHRQLPADASS